MGEVDPPSSASTWAVDSQVVPGVVNCAAGRWWCQSRRCGWCRACITYYPVGLAPEASRFFYFILILFLLHSMVRAALPPDLPPPPDPAS